MQVLNCVRKNFTPNIFSSSSKYFYCSGSQGPQFYVSCHSGLEQLVAQELESEMIGAKDVEIGKAAVHFRGDNVGVAYRANLWLRTGARVFMKITEGNLDPNQPGGDELYRFGRDKVRWSDYIGRSQSLRWTANVYGCTDIPSANLVQQRLRDAVCDQIKAAHGQRPPKPKELRSADIPFHATVYKDKIALYRDMSGDSLNKRGYRPSGSTAMLNECIAAAILYYSGWHKAPKDSTLVDPMCGGGTILLEAALMAKNEAPGSYRITWPFMKWPDFDKKLWQDILQQSWAAKNIFKGKIIGIDKEEGRVRFAKFCRSTARSQKLVDINCGFMETWKLEQPPNFVVCNPPWGMQLLNPNREDTEEESQQVEQELQYTWKNLSQFIATQCKGSQVSILSGREDLLKRLRLKSKQTQVLSMGGMQCRLDIFDVPEQQQQIQQLQQPKPEIPSVVV